MNVFRYYGQLTVFFGGSEDATGDKYRCVQCQWWKVGPARAILEVRGDREGVMGSARAIVDRALETIV
jgi:hypothetical protein